MLFFCLLLPPMATVADILFFVTYVCFFVRVLFYYIIYYLLAILNVLMKLSDWLWDGAVKFWTIFVQNPQIARQNKCFGRNFNCSQQMHSPGGAITLRGLRGSRFAICSQLSYLQINCKVSQLNKTTMLMSLRPKIQNEVCQRKKWSMLSLVCNFCLSNAMHKHGLCRHAVPVCVCLSVCMVQQSLTSHSTLSVCMCVSVTFVHFVKTNKDIFKFFSLSVATPFWFLHTKRDSNTLTGTPLTGASNAGGVG